MEKELKKIIRFLRKRPYNLAAIGLSFISLIIMSIIFNILVGLISFIVLNLVWVVPYINTKKSYIKSKTRVATIESKKEINKKIESDEEMSNRKIHKKSTKKKKNSIFKKVLLVLLGLFIAGVIALIIFFSYIALSAGKFDPDKLYTKEASILYDKDGKQFAKLGTEMRTKIKYDDMSEALINAIIATEDSRFFEHNGFDLPRFLKASFGQLLGQNAGGASTLTMQVSKNQFTSTTSSGFAGIKRKFTDIYMAIFQIEKNYSKEEILEFYANSYYLGSGAYGVEQAAQTYFGKNASELNISEAAMIAGMFQSPVTYDPNLNPEQTEKRRQTVLKLMKRHNYITEDEYNVAKEMTVDKIVKKGNKASTESTKYQGFIDTVAVDVQEKTGYDPYSYSMKIYTTMDREAQDYISSIMNGENYTWENDKVDAGIVVINTKTGSISAVGAGRNNSGAKSFNNATMIKRQIGSTAKPLYDYGPAIEYLDWNTNHPIIDAKYTYSDGTEINNWDGGYKGIITIREALVDSRNIPALKTFQSVDNGKIKTFVESLGLSPEVSNGKIHEAHAIGGYTGESPLTLAAAYAAFGNSGKYNKPYSFTKVVFDKNNKTKTVKTESKEVMGSDTAYMITDMLVDTGKSALGRYSNINGSQYAAKTGTTNFDEKTKKAHGLPDSAVNDLWVAGYNAEYSIAVWYGYDKISDGYNYFGSSQNSKLFNAVAKHFFKSSVTFTKPDTVTEVTVEKYCATSLLPSENTPDTMKTTELFKTKSKPTEVSNRYAKLNNVTEAKSTVSGRKVTLSWKAIDTPDGLNSSYWSTQVNKAFKVSSDQSTYLNYIMNYNNSVLGSVVYNIYLKSGDNLTKVTTTSATSATIKMPSAESPTYVIKASYSAYAGCESTGTEVKVDYSGESSGDIRVTLADGKQRVEVTTSEGYIDPSSPVKVTLDDENITDEVTNINITYSKNGSAATKYAAGTKLTEAGTYTFTYTVTYEDSKETITRTVKITE